MAHIGYVRVSTAEQHEDRQKAALEKYNIDRWFCEKVSGKNIQDRPELKALLDYVREGDTVYVEDFSRLARSTQDLLSIVKQLHQKKAQLVSAKEQFDTTTPTGEMMLTMIAAINQFERQTILERQAEGIAIAKKRGIYKGRKRIKIKEFEKYYKEYKNREIPTKTALAKRLGVSRPTLDRLIKEYTDSKQ